MENILERFLKLPLGNICDANGKTGAMDCAIHPVDPDCHMAGCAYTVRGMPGDNLALHKAILDAPEGSVIVADMGGYTRGGHFGEIMARACQAKGIAGLVIDGAIRDAKDLCDLGFPVFARCSCPNGTVKESVGVHQETIACGGMTVSPGDLIVGSIDGVVVVPKEKIESVLEGAEAIAAKEDKIPAMIDSGMTTVDIYKFPKLYSPRNDE